LQKFNESVKTYEKREKFLTRWDVTGIIEMLATSQVNGGFWLPLGTWFTKVLAGLLSEKAESNSVLRSILDSFQSLVTMSTPNAVLVNRIKKRF
jgi:hypothetical protein